MNRLFIKDAGFYKKVAGIALPIALQGLITQGVNMMDTLMIGTVGETELSALRTDTGGITGTEGVEEASVLL